MGACFPDMGTVFIAMDRCDTDNGCLKVCESFLMPRNSALVLHVQVLKGSHLLGRIDHKMVGGQTGADMERVEQVMKVRG